MGVSSSFPGRTDFDRSFAMRLSESLFSRGEPVFAVISNTDEWHELGLVMVSGPFPPDAFSPAGPRLSRSLPDALSSPMNSICGR